MFDENDLEWIYLMRYLIKSGMSFSKLRKHIEKYVDRDPSDIDCLELLEIKRFDIEKQLVELQEKMDKIIYIIKMCENEFK